MTTGLDLVNLVDNPVRRARKDLGLSLHEVADKSGTNYQTWYLSERGCYARVPPVILSYLERVGGFNSLYLEKEYKEFVRRTREDFHNLHFNLYRFLDCSSLRNVYEGLGLTRSAFAKALCVQPAVLYKYESGKQKSLPEQLKEAMKDAGFPVGIIKQLEGE